MNNSAATIQFYGQEILVVVDEAGERWVALRSICEGIGIATFSQQEKVRTDPKFNWHDIMSVGGDGKQRSMFCIPISQLNGWLFSINANRVKPEIRDRLVMYQRECQEVLFRYFMPNGGTNEELQRTVENLTGELTSLRHHMNEQHLQIRGEIAELSSVQDMMIDAEDEKEIRDLIKEVHTKTGMPKLSIVGHIRKLLGTSGVYDTAHPRQVKNLLRNMVGKGVLGPVRAPKEVQ